MVCVLTSAMADLQQLVAGDQPAFEGLLHMLMSAQNEQRSQAEQIFSELKKHPDACVSQLIRSLRHSPDLQARSLCAIMLRKVLTKDDPSLWPSLTDNTKEMVKAEMLNCIKEEPMRPVTKKVCDTVAELASGTLDEATGKGWDQLLPFMFQCVQSGEERLMESALLMFAQLAVYVMGVLAQYLGTIHGLLQSCLSHASMDVQLAAMKATCNFIQALENASDRDQFQVMLPQLLQLIGKALMSGNTVAGQDALEMLIEVAGEHPRFLRKQLVQVVDAMMQVAEASTLESGSRQLAVELVVTLCEAREKAPGMMRKLPQFLDRLFKCLLTLLLDVEDDPDWYTADDEKEEDAGEGELYQFGQECLDRIALALGGKTLVPLAGAALPPLLEQSDWRQRHAALICLSQIAEGCVKVMATQTAALVQLCVKGATDKHPRVRWAACQALGQMCTDLGPELQEEQHSVVLPLLVHLMEDNANPRVQAHACAAVVNFAENCDQDVVAPYLDGLITKLLLLLQTGKKNVQEGALTALASVADCSQDYFVKYYDAVMPQLKAMLLAANAKPQALLRAKALECVSLVGMAVGKERFRTDAHEVMQYMRAVQQAQLDPDDPLASYMLQAGARICKALGEEFLPYLEVVMPPLLHSARLQPDVTVAEASDDEDDDGADGEVETYIIGDRKISLRTSVLEEKATACSMICCYADELKEGFYPYVEQVTQLMVPLLKFYFHEEVRSAAAQSLPELLRSASLAAAKGRGPDAAFVRSMLGFMWGPLVEAVGKEPDAELLVTMLEAVDELVDIAEGPKLLPLEELTKLFEAFAVIMEAYEDRRKDRLKRMASEDFDAEEGEALEEEHEAETELLDALGSCITTVMRQYNDSAMPLLEALMPGVARLLEKGRFPEERRIAICVMDDIVEHAPRGSEKYMGQVMPVLLSGCADRDPAIRQCSVYGLGTAAQHRREAFRQYAAQAVPAVMAMLQATDARSEDNEMAYENAVSALGKVLEFHPECVEPHMGSHYVAALPVKADTVEAKVVHAQLVRFIQASDRRVLGENNANLPRIVEVFVKVLGKGEKLVDGDTARAMAVLLHQMQAALPAGVFDGFVSSLKPKQQEALRKVLSGQ